MLKRALPGLEHVRVALVQAEVAAAVLVMDPGLRIDDTGPEAQVVRLDEAHGVAGAIDRGQVHRAAADRAGSGPRSAGPCQVDLRRQIREAVPVQEHLDRHLARGRVGQVGVAIGHGHLGGLEMEMDPARVGDTFRSEGARAGRLEPLQQAEQLERDDPGAVRRVGRHADTAVVDRDRLAPRRRVLAQVLDPDRRSRRRPGPEPGAHRGRRRRRHRSPHAPASRACPRAPSVAHARRAATGGRLAGRRPRSRPRRRRTGPRASGRSPRRCR